MRNKTPIILWVISFLIALNTIGCEIKKEIKKEKYIEEVKGCLYGLFMTNTPGDIRVINNFEMKSQKKAGMIMFYTDWKQEFPMEDCINIVNYGAIPHVTWEPWLGLDDIVEGRKDEYIIKWAKDAKGFGYPFFLRWGHEMNGDWYPWSGAKNNNDASKYVKAYRHIHDIFMKVGAADVIWVWSPADRSVPNVGWNNARNYYPGDEFVDWLGIDGYNWGNTQNWSQWVDFDHIFKRRYEEFIQKYPNKPIMIAEFASAEGGGNKGEWITNTFESMKEKYPQVRSIVWFNINKECDWRIDSSSKALESFKSVIKDPYFISDPSLMPSLLKGFKLPKGVTAELTPLKIVWEKPEVVIAKAKEPVKIDGNLVEWQTAEGIIFEGKKRIALGAEAWEGKEDLSAEIKFMWDEENLYIGAKIHDDFPLINRNGTNNKIWDGDGLEIAFSIDPEADPSRTSFLDCDYQIAFGTGYKQEVEPSNWSWQLVSPIKEIEMCILSAKDFNGYYLEAKIPFFEVLGLRLKEGLKIDFDVVINDADQSEVRETQFVWSGDSMFYKEPNMWGKAVVVEK